MKKNKATQIVPVEIISEDVVDKLESMKKESLKLNQIIHKRVEYILKEICRQCKKSFSCMDIIYDVDSLDIYVDDDFDEGSLYFVDYIAACKKEGELYLETRNHGMEIIIDGKEYDIFCGFPYKWLFWNFEEELAAGIEEKKKKDLAKKKEAEKYRKEIDKQKKEKETKKSNLAKQLKLNCADMIKLKELLREELEEEDSDYVEDICDECGEDIEYCICDEYH